MYRSICTMVSTSIDGEVFLELNVDGRRGLWFIDEFSHDENNGDTAKTIKEFDNLKDAKTFYDDHLKSLEGDHYIDKIFDMFWCKDN